MTLRTVAGDRLIGSSCDSVRDPTGSPFSKKLSTIFAKITRERSLSSSIMAGSWTCAGRAARNVGTPPRDVNGATGFAQV